MTADQRTRLAAEVTAAEEEVARRRTDNAALAEEFRASPTEEGRAQLKRAAASLSAARDRVEAAKAALEILDRTGDLHGIVAEGGRLVGTVAVSVPAGASRADREKAIDEALLAALGKAANELGVVLGTSPERYTRERPGRDAEGRTILDVAGRVEGDVLVPAVSRAAKAAR